jgi:membrane protein
MSSNAIFGLLKIAFWRWWRDEQFRLGAAMAYYAVFSLAPLALITLAVAGLVFQENTAREEFLRESNETLGPLVGRAIESIVSDVETARTGSLATLFGLLLLLLGATSVFAQIQDALNLIRGVKVKKGTGWRRSVKNRFWSFTVVLGVGLLLLVSLVLSAALAAFTHFVAPSAVPGWTYTWQVLNWLISFGLVTLLFAFMYKVLPDVEIEWREVWVGAAVTALLFALGKYAIGLYLGRCNWISAYGAAGALLVVLLWVYYSSQLFLFGAEFTYVYAKRSGKALLPKKDAELITQESNGHSETE